MTLSTNKKAALALVFGALAGLMTMVVHPTGADVIRNASAGESNALNTGAHLLALIGEGLILAGALVIVNNLRVHRDLAILGYVFFTLATIAIMIAAIASGFLAPSVLRGIGEATPESRKVILQALRYTGLLNHAFANLYVIFASVAIAIWSAVMFRTAQISRGLGIYGLILSAVLIVASVSGYLKLDIHGFGLVALGQGIWLILMAKKLWDGADPLRA